MKIGAIRKLILGGKSCRILNGERGQQWMGNSRCIVRVDDGLRIGPESIKGLFDLDVEQAEKLKITEERLEEADMWPVPSRTMVKLAGRNIALANMGGLEIIGQGGTAYLIETGLVKVDIDKDDYKEYMLAWDKEDNPLITIWDGMLMCGIIRPLDRALCEKILTEMETIGGFLPGGWIPREQKDYQFKLPPEGGQQLDMDDFRTE